MFVLQLEKLEARPFTQAISKRFITFKRVLTAKCDLYKIMSPRFTDKGFNYQICCHIKFTFSVSCYYMKKTRQNGHLECFLDCSVVTLLNEFVKCVCKVIDTLRNSIFTKIIKLQL